MINFLQVKDEYSKKFARFVALILTALLLIHFILRGLGLDDSSDMATYLTGIFASAVGVAGISLP